MTVLRKGQFIRGTTPDDNVWIGGVLHDSPFVRIGASVANGPYSVVVVHPEDARTIATALLDVADIIEKQAHRGWDGREVERDCL